MTISRVVWIPKGVFYQGITTFFSSSNVFNLRKSAVQGGAHRWSKISRSILKLTPGFPNMKSEQQQDSIELPVGEFALDPETMFEAVVSALLTDFLWPPDSHIGSVHPKETHSIAKTILEDEIHPDIVIMAKGNIPIKAHRAFLCCTSAVFQKMFENPGLEIFTVDMSDITPSGVHAFLAYVYYMDISRPINNCLSAVELLQCAHKYDMSGLQSNMKSILLSKEDSWYNVEVAMMLFRFSRKIYEGEELKFKAVMILKRNHKELLESESYKNMFEEDQEATKELVQLAFSL